MSALNIPAVAVLVWLMLTEGGSEPALTRLSSGWLPVATSMGPWLLLAGLFTSVRRWNGYAAWHDLASRTRVVERAVMQKPTHARRPAVSVPAVQAAVATRGAFRVLGEALPGMPAGWRPGFDDRLRRDVWIREVAPGTPPLDSVRIAINRPTRLRWLAGRRESGEAWDVFEAVAGVPLAQACTRPRPWADVRWWLLDLARELAAQSAEDGPPLRADRVWVLESGGAKLVDDPAADRDASASGGSGPPPSSTSLLLDVVRTAQGPAPAPWPRCAHQVIDQLRGTQTPADAVLVQTLEGTTRQRATLTRRWRAFHIGLLAAPPALMAVFISFSVTLMVQRVQQVHADVRIAVTGLQHLGLADRGRLTLSDDGREALEVALATRYRSVLTDGRLQRMEYFPLILPPDQQAIVERVLRRRPTAEESRSAGAHPAVKMAVAQALRSPDLPPAWALAIALLGGGLLFVAVPSLIGALAFRGALVRMLGLELVTSDGRPASRLRVLGRATLAWLPVLVAPVVVLAAESMGVRAPAGGPWVWTMSVAVPVTLAGAVVALIRPERGLQDRLAGTWIVPR
jgi:hypothetical protein